MKAILLAVGLLACLFAGCSSLPAGASRPSVVQQALDIVLPRTFKGDVHVEHSNPYFGFTLDAGNLRWEQDGWRFDWLVLDRHGWSRGKTRLGNPPPRPL